LNTFRDAVNGWGCLCHIFKWRRNMKKVGNHCSNHFQTCKRLGILLLVEF